MHGGGLPRARRRGDRRALHRHARVGRAARPELARTARRRQALDGRRRRQDHARRRAAGRRVRRAGREDVRPRLEHDGTLDKLESIPGFRVQGLAIDQLFVAGSSGIGVAVVAQTASWCRADAAMYALRDVTGTVPAPGLIAASVMSKKLAAGADAMVLDVKGRGRRVSTGRSTRPAWAGAPDVRPRRAGRHGCRSARSPAWTSRSGALCRERASRWPRHSTCSARRAGRDRAVVLASAVASWSCPTRRCRTRASRRAAARASTRSPPAPPSPRRCAGSRRRAATHAWSTSRGR